MKTVNECSVELLDRMGDDITIVNAARVSFDKESDWESLYIDNELTHCLSDRDKKLINYLARHNHWSPFAHTSIQLRVTAPIFISRQLGKHQVGLVWNEVSRRYVDEEPVFFFPDKWRKRAENKKQGSSDESVCLKDDESVEIAVDECLIVYEMLLDKGVAPEQARMILPQNMITSWIWTGSLIAFHRVYKQRTDEHAQKEVQDVAHKIGAICEELFPYSWRALNGSTM